ncbi:MAG: neutral/alkaline non-lysosomal ceramidase N-terminal domain-containing protein [Acidobacteria bacterium]|nr:neutral/alkaline non-lysosomal ceramidase N-terminal domain-containing protein [Acidobacteriota bacterium]
MLLLAAVSPLVVAAQGWQAGAASITITPEKPIWMAGYGNRDRPAEGTAQQLHAKALALRDDAGGRAVLVTTDMLGFPQDLARRVTTRAEQLYGLSRERILLNSSHTHTGPVVGRTLAAAYPKMSDEQWADVDEYTQVLEDKVIRVIGQALANLKPAEVSFGRTRAGFAVNRRLETPDGFKGGNDNWEGPVDHDVPILRVRDAEGTMLAIVFGYACHNTAIRGTDYEFHGGWAGTAQQVIEEDYPGAVALFMMGCGADANPYPRGGVEMANQHGKTIAGMVSRAVAKEFPALAGPLKPVYEEFPVAFAQPPPREEFERRLRQGNEYEQFHARLMLKTFDEKGSLPRRYPYPAQVWRFGDGLTLIALGGEVVVDYALRLKKELGADKLWVAGYSNDVFAYIPSLRVLNEGGYEAESAMIYYGQPGRFASSIEETIIGKIHELVKKAR